MSASISALESIISRSPITSFLTSSDLGSVKRASSECLSSVDQHLIHLINRYRAIAEGPFPLDKQNALIQRLIEQSEAQIPADAVSREGKVARKFFENLSEKYVTISQPPSKASGLHDAMAKEDRADIGLIEIFRFLFPARTAEEQASFEEQETAELDTLRLKARLLGIEDLYDLVQTDEYPRATQAEILARVPIEMQEEARTESVISKFLKVSFKELPQAVISRPAFGPDSVLQTLHVLASVIQIKQKREIYRLLTSLPEKTQEEVEVKASALRQKIDCHAAFVAIYCRASSPVALSNKKLEKLPPEVLRISATVFDLSSNNFKAAPALAPSAVRLTLSRNPKMKRFDALNDLPHLRELRLSHNAMSKLPDSIARLRLNILDLSHNHFVSWPSSATAVECVDMKGNPLIFIPQEIVEKLPISLETRSYEENSDPARLTSALTSKIDGFSFCQEMLSEPTSALGKLYKQFVKPESAYDYKAIQSAVEALAVAEQHLVFEMVWKERGSPETKDTEWGRHYAFDNLNALARAVRAAITLKLERMPTEQREKIIAAADGQARLVGKKTSDVLTSGSVLADAMEKSADASFSGPLWSVRANDTLELSVALSSMGALRSAIHSFQRSEQRWSDKYSLLVELQSFSDCFSRLRDMLGADHHPMPAGLEENYALLMSTVPSIFLRMTIDDIIRERNEETPPPITAANYLGRDFNVEANYNAESFLGRYLNAHLGLRDASMSVEELLLQMSRYGYNDTSFFNLGIQLSMIAGFPHETTYFDLSQFNAAIAFGILSFRPETIQRIILERFEALSPDRKNAVYGHIYELAGRPDTTDAEWGRNHAKDSLSRLADALERAGIYS